MTHNILDLLNKTCLKWQHTGEHSVSWIILEPQCINSVLTKNTLKGSFISLAPQLPMDSGPSQMEESRWLGCSSGLMWETDYSFILRRWGWVCFIGPHPIWENTFFVWEQATVRCLDEFCKGRKYSVHLPLSLALTPSRASTSHKQAAD